MKSRVRRTIVVLLVVAVVVVGIMLGVQSLGGVSIHEFFQKMHGG